MLTALCVHRRTQRLRRLRHWRIAVLCGVAAPIVGIPAAGRWSPLHHPPARGTGRPADSTVARVYDNAVEAFASRFAEFVIDGGLLTDELREPLSGPGSTRRTLGPTLQGSYGGTGGWPYSSKYPWRRLSWIDMRTLPERWDSGDTAAEAGEYIPQQEFFLDDAYLHLQGTRVTLSSALAQLAGPAADASMSPAQRAAERGELYALAGYADIALADLFCSGVPLNTVTDTFSQRIAIGLQKPGGILPRRTYLRALAVHQVIYHPGATTQQVYRDAIGKFDTALSLAGASVRVLNLARVGKGRAFLALGAYDSAAAAVAAVPRGFAYRLRSFWNLDPDGDEVLATVADREGGNGLPYLTSADPRTATKETPSDKGMGLFRFPTKFWPDSDRRQGRIHSMVGFDQRSGGLGRFETWEMHWPWTLASWEEAVLIQAEAALHQHPDARGWLRLLNELRATAPIPGTEHAASTQLPPLRDPGTPRGRLQLVFAERAAWLFLTGHRQGDLRRLVREYGWPQATVYPTGPYPVAQGLLPTVGTYGTDVNLPIPPEELSNPQFLGCLDRGA